MTAAENAERLFARVFSNLTWRHTDMITFRRLADLGKPVAIATLHQEQLALANEILTNPAYKKIFPDPKVAIEFFGGPVKMAAVTASQEIQKFSRIVEAASLVFLHSAVDAAISDLCRVTLLLDRAGWEQYVLATKVTLADAKTASVETLTAQKLEVHLAALEKESMLKRIDRLFALCKPAKDFTPIGAGFAFDSERLSKLDDQRHRIVHGEGYHSFGSVLADDLEFLMKSGLFLWSMVNMRYGVKLNPLYAIGIELPAAAAPAASASV